MTLTPDQIQSRTFATTSAGYDPDEVRKFLLEVASAVRLAMHSTAPPIIARPTPAAAPSPSPAPVPTEAPVARNATPSPALANREADQADGVLRAALEAARQIRERAEADANAIREAAAHEAQATRDDAEAKAAWHADRAKRLLTTAQGQADNIVAEAERQAREIMSGARDHGNDLADRVSARARRHAHEILCAERDALLRLHEAQARLASAIDVLRDSESRPVIDLTHARPAVLLGDLSVDMAGEAPDEAAALADPIVRMVRSAVDRAVEHSALVDPDGDGDSADDAGAAATAVGAPT